MFKNNLAPIVIPPKNQAGESVANLCREYGMSQATFYKWRSKYDDALPSHATELFTSLFQ